MLLVFAVSLINHVTNAWPDGAPCVRTTFESMNPLEAVEHQGGLMLTNPPYTIDVVQKCYWRGQPIELVLRGNSTSDRFRGFVIQPISYRGPHEGKRTGQFLRLDDNGSWQQQCFRFKDSVTHSHDEKKKRMKLWWKNDYDEDDYVQFVATVVKAQKEFWVKSVKSVPIPPCRLERNGITDYIPGPVTAPPPVKSFKLETAMFFDGLEENSFIPRDVDTNEVTPKPQKFEDAFRSIQLPPNVDMNPLTAAPRTVIPAPTTIQPAQIVVQQRVPIPPGRIVDSDNRMNNPIAQPISAFPQHPAVPQVRERQRLTHVIPIAELRTVPRPGSSGTQPSRLVLEPSTSAPLLSNNQMFPSVIRHHRPQPIRQPQVQRPPQLLRQSIPTRPALPQRSPIGISRPNPLSQPGFSVANQRSFVQTVQQNQRIFVNNQAVASGQNVCVDLIGYERCAMLVRFCQTRAYVQMNCRRTCRLC